ncbi:uncharacterized protein RHIMIDRAFT_259021 [Rhizopus microsporus ATCC 52813]|uniref:Homeobox domain-containing protein n=1 Tax=Rhizopus microsporus ATCC 52813 TaxID=1340429 RepID=A0A2G4SQY7_RHIZD|nr:uncharacterized protein RHIMIDRAFT_259021 [Rhizopus microsporus ATCC 52813]PHZ11152.1 hypothetical protein RHIMIDRAFT_259021 [Rhizopus microsporus ATCC 52813]
MTTAAAATTSSVSPHGITTHVATAMTANTSTFKIQQHDRINNDVIQIKPKRKRISPQQFHLLSESFKQTDTPNYDLREKLAKQLDMTNREVQASFFFKVFI